MYWGQAIVSFLVAVSIAYSEYVRGRPTIQAALVGIVAYIFIRWFVSWIYRIRYWHQRGTRGVYTETCPNCRRGRHRLPGDWILKCHACGWKPGIFFIRWFTRSLPAQQLRRTIIGPQLVILVFAIFLLTTGAAAGYSVQNVSSGADLFDTQSVDGEYVDNAGVNETEVESRIFQILNERRASRSMNKLDYNTNAADAARSHADDMAANNYFSHTSQDGVTQQQRYAFCNGGENAHQTWVNRDVRLGSGRTVFYSNEKELSKGVMKQWINSDPHRERGIYGDLWTSAGVGVSVTSDGKVYAVLGFCSQ
jgi:uncharacterized protein YkwD